jgi:hypothetical protein
MPCVNKVLQLVVNLITHVMNKNNFKIIYNCIGPITILI